MNGAIVLAAGQGTRYHGKKQDLLFHGKPLWRYAYETTMLVVGKENIVAVGKDMPGGQTRSGSVMIGLEVMKVMVMLSVSRSNQLITGWL